MDGRRLKYSDDHQSRGKMTSCIRVPLILSMLLVQLCRFANSKCSEAIESVVNVTSCPKSKEEWESAAKIKNCSITAAQQTCTNADEFVYHCVIDGFQKETLEVCAPRKLIHGYCAEFNVAGGVIQTQYASPCNNATFPICNKPYQSTEAYNYQGCYELVYSKKGINSTTMPTYIPENDSQTNIIVAVCAVVLVIFITVVSGYFIRKRLKKRSGKKSLTDKEEQKTLIQSTCEHEQEPSKDITAMDEIKEIKPPLRKDVDAATGADRYTMANIKTEEEYCEENRGKSISSIFFFYRTMLANP